MHAESVEKCNEVRIGSQVVNDEAGIDGAPPFRSNDVNSVGVPAQAPLRLVHDNVVPLTEQPGGAQSRYTRPNDRNLHSKVPVFISSVNEGNCELDRPGRIFGLPVRS